MPNRKYRLLVETPDTLPAEDVNSLRVRVRAQSNVTLASPGATIDGVTMALGQEFLADQQSTPAQDGLYVWNGASVPATRSPKLPVGARVGGIIITIKEGTDADKVAVFTDDETADVVGTNDLSVAPASGPPPAYAFTGTAPTSAVVQSIQGTGFSTTGQVITTTESFTASLNQYAGCWFLSAAGTPCVITSHPAVTGAPLVLTVYGEAPPTSALSFKVFRGFTPAGTIAVD